MYKRQFLGDVFANDADLLDYVQRLTGYALSGQRGEHLLPIFYGSGANGKSTFLTTVQSMLGEYAGTAAPGLLVKKHGSDDMTATSESVSYTHLDVYKRQAPHPAPCAAD